MSQSVETIETNSKKKKENLTGKSGREIS